MKGRALALCLTLSWFAQSVNLKKTAATSTGKNPQGQPPRILARDMFTRDPVRGGYDQDEDEDIEDSPLSVLQRRRGRRTIHVTELTSQDWCEMQLDFVLRCVEIKVIATYKQISAFLVGSRMLPSNHQQACILNAGWRAVFLIPLFRIKSISDVYVHVE
jgi:hypothetical protein